MKYAVLRLKKDFNPSKRGIPSKRDYEHVNWLSTLPRYPIVERLNVETLGRLMTFVSTLPSSKKKA